MTDAQKRAIEKEISFCEDDIYRCKMELGRGGQSVSEKASLADRIARREEELARLKVAD